MSVPEEHYCESYIPPQALISQGDHTALLGYVSLDMLQNYESQYPPDCVSDMSEFFLLFHNFERLVAAPGVCQSM